VVKISAPAFTLDFKEHHVNIDELTKMPITLPCIPHKKGNHFIVLDFYDDQEHRCGGISLPVQVREKEPIIGEKVSRVIQMSGGILGLVSAVILILEKVLPLFSK